LTLIFKTVFLVRDIDFPVVDLDIQVLVFNLMEMDLMDMDSMAIL